MPFKFATIPFEEIMKRLFKSRYDFSCFQKLAKEYFPAHDEKLNIKKYEKLSKKEKEESLIDLSEKCTRLPKYKGYYCQEVILHTICSIDIPLKWFRIIFGHREEEDSLYPLVHKFLKSEFKNHKVIPTYNQKSRVGIRYPDFTIIKKHFGGRYELLSFDVKVKPSAFDYFLNQAHDFLGFSDYTFLACTAGFILEAGKKWGKRPVQAEEVLIDKLAKLGVGLCIVDAESSKVELLARPKKSSSLDGELKNRVMQELGFT